MHQKTLVFVFSLFATSFTFFSQEGKLDQAKESLKSKKTSNKASKRTVKTSNSSAMDDTFENPFLEIIWYVSAYTVYGIAFESPWEFNSKMSDAEIANYPYKEAHYGNFIYTDSTNYNITRFDIYNRFLIESKHLYGNDLGINFRFFKRFGLDVNYTQFIEKVTKKTDYFTLYSALLKYHRIRTQRFDAWFGLGVSHIANNVNETGFTYGFGAEWFVKKPISLVFSYKATSINNRIVNNTKLLLKYHIKNYRISSGYEHYQLGISKVNAFSFGVEASF